MGIFEILLNADRISQAKSQEEFLPQKETKNKPMF